MFEAALDTLAGALADDRLQMIDSTLCGHTVKLPAQKGQQRKALGRSRGGFSTKFHVRADAPGPASRLPSNRRPIAPTCRYNLQPAFTSDDGVRDIRRAV